MTRRLLAALAAAVVALAGCGGGGDGFEGFNQHDADFASSMVQHHEQALQMSQLASQRAAGPEVKALAAQIAAAQGPEIDQMAGWIQEWGSHGATMPPHGIVHEAHGPGMMTADQMAQLEEASGPAFDKLFLELMIVHHEGAVTMAEDERDEGDSDEAKALAESIRDAQTTEIERMKELLGQG